MTVAQALVPFATVEAVGVSTFAEAADFVMDIFDKMFLEISFLIFFFAGYAFLKMDSFSRKKRKLNLLTKGNTAFDMAIKGVKSEHAAGNSAAALEAWRQNVVNAGFKECLPMDVIRIVVSCICELEGRAFTDGLQQLGSYINSFKDAYAAMPVLDEKLKKMRKPQTPAEGVTRILTQIVLAAAGSSHKTDTIFSTLQGVLGAPVGEEMYEALAGAYAAEGDTARVNEMLAALAAHSCVAPRAYNAVVAGFLKTEMLPEARSYLNKQTEVCAPAPYVLVELARVAAPVDGPKAALAELKTFCSSNSTVPEGAVALVLEESARRADGEVPDMVEEMMTAGICHLTYYGLDALAKAYAASANLKAITYFDNLAKGGYTISDGSCVGIITACAESKFLKCAEHIVQTRREQGALSLSMYSALMKVYAASKLFDKCCDLYPQVLAAGFEPDAVMIGCLMNFAARAGRSDLSAELFSSSKHPVEVQNYMSQIRACRHNGDVKRAIRLLRELRDRGLEDKAAVNSVLDVCVCAGKLDDALALFEEQAKAGTNVDIISYNTLIKGYCNQHETAKAKKLFGKLEEMGLVANDVTYNSILNAHVRERSYDLAWEWYLMMKKALPEDTYTISTLAKSLKTCQDQTFIERVLSVLDTTQVDITSDDVLLNVILDAFVRMKDMKRLHGVVQKVQNMTMVPPVTTVNTLMKAFNTLKRIDEVMELWRMMTEVRNLEPDSISIGCVTDALVSNDRVDEAAKFIKEQSKKYQMNTIHYSTLIKGFAINRNSAGAWQAYMDMKEAGIAPNLVTMNTLMDAFARAGKMRECAEVLEDIKENMNFKPDRITYSTIVKGFCMQGQIDQAIAVMESIHRGGFPSDVIIFNTILDACCSRDRFAMCDHLYEQMLSEGIKPTNFTLTVLIKRHGREGNVAKAFKVMETLPAQFGFKANLQAYTCLISACVMNRQMPKAINVLEGLKKNGPTPDGVTYDKIITGYLRSGDPAAAIGLVRDAYGLHGALGVSKAPPSASGSVTPGGTQVRVSVDAKVLENLLDNLAAKGMAGTHGVPLVQDLRKAKVPLPQKVVSLALHGATRNPPKTDGSKKQYTNAPWAKNLQ
jgi:pentatricopeptide repeat protein